MRRKVRRVYIVCCGLSQVAHQNPKGSGDYRIHCSRCGRERWETK